MRLKFNQTHANWIFALCMTWAGLIAVNAIPDGPVTHWISVAATGMQLFLVNLGFQRTPRGNVIPNDVAKLIDASHVADTSRGIVDSHE